MPELVSDIENEKLVRAKLPTIATAATPCRRLPTMHPNKGVIPVLTYSKLRQGDPKKNLDHPGLGRKRKNSKPRFHHQDAGKIN